MGYSIRTSNYLKRISLSDSTHMISMADFVVISIVISRINSRCSLEKEFTGLIYMDP